MHRKLKKTSKWKMNVYIPMKISLEIKSILKKAAGLAADQESFLNSFEFVDPGEDCKNIKFDDSSQKLSEAQFPLSSSSVGLLRSGRKPKVAATEHLFL